MSVLALSSLACSELQATLSLELNNSTKGTHPFHIVDVSPWPLLCSLALLGLAFSCVSFLWRVSVFSMWLLGLSCVLVGVVAFQWWRDVIRESTFQGEHTLAVCNGLYMGVVMFIISELMFFFSFFFGFFFVCFCPDVSIGCNWPPCGVEPLSCNSVPLLNSLLLLSSGVTITWAHHSLLQAQIKQTLVSLMITVVLGALFIVVQIEEYCSTSFSMEDGVFGSFFFLMTGFHGLHVSVGLVFIVVEMIRLASGHFSSCHNLGFECSAWYWHFVDVVWLFLFVWVYWWGS